MGNEILRQNPQGMCTKHGKVIPISLSLDSDLNNSRGLSKLNQLPGKSQISYRQTLGCGLGQTCNIFLSLRHGATPRQPGRDYFRETDFKLNVVAVG